MSYADLPLEQMRAHVSASVESADFDGFWAGTLAESPLSAGPRTSPRSTTGCR